MWMYSKTFSPIGALLQVWDAFGRLLYQSSLFDYPVTSVAWSPSGEQFAVGSFNTMQLCDRMGWAYSKVRGNRSNPGSITNRVVRGARRHGPVEATYTMLMLLVLAPLAAAGAPEGHGVHPVAQLDGGQHAAGGVGGQWGGGVRAGGRPDAGGREDAGAWKQQVTCASCSSVICWVPCLNYLPGEPPGVVKLSVPLYGLGMEAYTWQQGLLRGRGQDRAPVRMQGLCASMQLVGGRQAAADADGNHMPELVPTTGADYYSPSL